MKSLRRTLTHVSLLLATGFATASWSGSVRADEPAAAGTPPAEATGPSEPATAPTPEAVQEAGQRYDRGLKMYAEGDYPLAVIEFERAYELVPDYRVLYNIGQVRIQLANYARARRALEQYLSEGADRIPADRRTAVEADLEMLASRTGTLRIETNIDGAEIVVDDAIVGQSPLSEPLLLDAGEHRLNVRKSGYYPKSSQATLAGRDALQMRLDLEKIPEAGSNRIIVQQRMGDDSDRSSWVWGTWSATGVFVVGAAIFGGLGIKAANDLDDKRSESGASRSELDSASSRAQTLLRTADVLGGLAVVTGGVALYLTLSSPDPAPGKDRTKSPALKKPIAKQVGLSVRPGWVGLSGTY